MGRASETPREVERRLKTIQQIQLTLLALLALTSLLIGCSKDSSSNTAPERESASQQKPDDRSSYQILTTVGMITDITREIVGQESQITVSGLIGSGVDPHLFKPTRSDVAQILSADVVLYNGHMLEGRLVDAFDRATKSGKTVVALAEKIPAHQLISPDNSGQIFDPHLWMDPKLWSHVALQVIETLSAYDPVRAPLFQSNGARYLERTRQLDEYAQAALASIPASNRLLVTAHDAFSYFGHRFQLDVLGIQGISTDSEAGVRKIEELVNIIVSRKVPAIFVESTVSDRNIRALIEGAAAQGHTVKIGGQLYSDAMGPANTPAGTYIGMLEHNINTITEALGGKLPASTLTVPDQAAPDQAAVQAAASPTSTDQIESQ